MRLSALLTCLLLSAAPAGAAEWVRVETPNFIVYGEPGERRVREIADEFERFREALARVIPGAGTPAAVPTVVVVFGSARSFESYRPRFNGKPIRLGGYFFSSDDINIVALADADRAESLRTIFHEYVHLVIDNVSEGMRHPIASTSPGGRTIPLVVRAASSRWSFCQNRASRSRRLPV